MRWILGDARCTVPTMRKLTILVLGMLCLPFLGALLAQDLVESGGSSIGEVAVVNDKLAGKITASGEKYNPQERTATHRTLAFGTLAWVTNLENKRSVLVRINHRGPTSKKLEMEISRSAAIALGMQGEAKARAQITPLQVRSQPTPLSQPEEFAIAIATYPDLLRAVYRQMGLEGSGISNIKIQRLQRQAGTFYRVVAGGYATPEEATAAASDLEARKLIEPR